MRCVLWPLHVGTDSGRPRPGWFKHVLAKSHCWGQSPPSLGCCAALIRLALAAARLLLLLLLPPTCRPLPPLQVHTQLAVVGVGELPQRGGGAGGRVGGWRGSSRFDAQARALAQASVACPALQPPPPPSCLVKQRHARHLKLVTHLQKVGQQRVCGTGGGGGQGGGSRWGGWGGVVVVRLGEACRARCCARTQRQRPSARAATHRGCMTRTPPTHRGCMTRTPPTQSRAAAAPWRRPAPRGGGPQAGC